MLVVDDDVMVRLAVDRQLEALGWEAFVVKSGEEAIRVLELGLSFDAVLTDVRLPDVDGQAVARTAARISSQTRIIFMSGFARPEPLEPGSAPFLMKPFSITALAHALGQNPTRDWPR